MALTDIISIGPWHTLASSRDAPAFHSVSAETDDEQRIVVEHLSGNLAAALTQVLLFILVIIAGGPAGHRQTLRQFVYRGECRSAW